METLTVESQNHWSQWTTTQDQNTADYRQAREAATCQRTWKIEQPVAVMEARRSDGQESYRQHRCGELAGHGTDHVCRYCGELIR